MGSPVNLVLQSMPERLRLLIGALKRALRIEQRLTLEESYQVLQVADAIFDYGRMRQEYYGFSKPYVIVEIPELALSFSETLQTVTDALLLLEGMGRAEPGHSPRLWRLKPELR
jgi:hypothetical protein